MSSCDAGNSNSPVCCSHIPSLSPMRGSWEQGLCRALESLCCSSKKLSTERTIQGKEGEVAFSHLCALLVLGCAGAGKTPCSLEDLSKLQQLPHSACGMQLCPESLQHIHNMPHLPTVTPIMLGIPGFVRSPWKAAFWLASAKSVLGNHPPSRCPLFFSGPFI